MNIFEAIKQRRSVKMFDPSHSLTTEEENKIFDLAFETPSSFNIQHWRLVKVADKDLRTKIRAAAWDQAQVTDASLLLILCADVKAWEKNPVQYWELAPKPVSEILVPLIHDFYFEKPELQRDEAMRSVGLMAQTIMLSVKAMGYDSCPMIGFDSKKVAELIALPADHVIGMMLAIGKSAKEAHSKGGYLPRQLTVIENRF